MWKADIIPRPYQEELARKVLKKGNTLIVAPTGIGKTLIALLVAKEILERGKKVIMLAPTRPLVLQHVETVRRTLDVEVEAVTGKDPPSQRERKYRAPFVVVTPQTLESDLLEGRVDLKEVGLLIVDEAHRAVGKYPYVGIATRYMEESESPLILALTASPGGSEDKIGEVVKNLHIRNVEVKTPWDEDVKPYVHGFDITWVKVELDEKHLKAIKLLRKAMKERLEELKRRGVVPSSDPSKYGRKELLELQKRTEGDWYILGIVGDLIRLDYAAELLETQGMSTFLEYVKKWASEKPKLYNDAYVETARSLASTLLHRGYDHPKLDKVAELVGKREGSIIVFVQYRRTARRIVEMLEDRGIRAVRFVGQATREGDKGLSQKEQKEILEKFKRGEFRVLVATSVAEEGIDIPSVDTVIFYEPVPSEIRTIQRRGRTGRARRGEVIVLVAKGTRDEAYYWAARHRERKMMEVLRRLKRAFSKKGSTLLDYMDNVKPSVVTIVADTREEVVPDILESEGDVRVVRRALPVGDYVLSDRVVVERKAGKDFERSIIDGRLFSQAKALSETYMRPVIIVEGEMGMKLHPNALRGALASLAIDYGISVIFTDSPLETAHLLKVMAKREQVEGGRQPVVRRGTKEGDPRINVLLSLPGVGPVTARKLLDHFGSVERVISADVNELARVVGKKRAKEIKDIVSGQ